MGTPRRHRQQEEWRELRAGGASESVEPLLKAMQAAGWTAQELDLLERAAEQPAQLQPKPKRKPVPKDDRAQERPK